MSELNLSHCFSWQSALKRQLVCCELYLFPFSSTFLTPNHTGMPIHHSLLLDTVGERERFLCMNVSLCAMRGMQSAPLAFFCADPEPNGTMHTKHCCCLDLRNFLCCFISHMDEWYHFRFSFTSVVYCEIALVQCSLVAYRMSSFVVVIACRL